MIDVEPELRAAAPTLFREPLPYGAIVGAGWIPILREACIKLENVALNMPEDERPRVADIKEKFGELRMRLSRANDECLAIVDEAERQSNLVCEDCALPGKLRTGSYLRTLCDGCYAARGVF